jgi:hypothetical protein
MNLRHAAALALVGWYLMLPPMNSWRGLPWIERNAPLSKWKQSAAFNSAKDCEVARGKHETDLGLAVKSNMAREHEVGRNPSAPIDDGALCIATDDPRLREK